MNGHEIKLWREVYLRSLYDRLLDPETSPSECATQAVLEFREACQKLTQKEEERPEVIKWLDEPFFAGYYYLEADNKAYYCFKRINPETLQDTWFYSKNHKNTSGVNAARLPCRVRMKF